METSLYLESRGNGIYAAKPHDSGGLGPDEYALKGFVDQVYDLFQKDGKYFALDLSDMCVMKSNDAREIIEAAVALERIDGRIYLCALGPEDKNPHKLVKSLGLLTFPNIEVRESIDAVVAEITQQH